MKLSCPQTLKFLKLKRRLGLTHWQAVGLLESLWLFAQRNSPHGDIGKHTDEDIAAGIEWEGDAAKLISELVECHWLDRCEVHRLLIHGWEEHAPTYLKGALAKNNQQFAKHGAKQPAKHGAKQPKTTPSKPANSTVLSDLHPNLTLPNLSLPSQTKPSPDSSEPDKAPASEPVVMVFLTVGKSGEKEWFLTESKLDEWSASFPGVDAKAECRKAAQWLRDNPTKRKTARGMPRFLFAWLERCQNRGPARNGPPAPSANGQHTEEEKRKARMEEARRIADSFRTTPRTP